jgi:hypothetical protein
MQCPPQLQPLPLGRIRDPFSNPDWIFEVKWGGFRALVRVNRQECAIGNTLHTKTLTKSSGDNEEVDELLYERKLCFSRSEGWSGWFCQRCCWNRPLPLHAEEQAHLWSNIQQLFEEHSCEDYRSKYWKA